MSTLQKVILNIIHCISNTPGAFDHGDSVIYGLRNYVARHSLASDQYYVSEAALAMFEAHKLSVPLRRGKLRKLKAYFTYEHPVPASLVVEQIRLSKRTTEEILSFLTFADCVTLVTKEEDRMLSTAHKSKMPGEWVFGVGSQFARYEHYGIKIHPVKIAVTGRLVR